MRLKFRVLLCALLALIVAAACGKSASARPAQELLPEESAVKGRQLVQQTIAALGGQAYLNVRDTDCDGRVAQYGVAGTLMGFTLFRDLWLLPDKNRVEYISKGEHTILGFVLGTDDLSITHGGALITVFTGEDGWTLDKAGVSNEPEDLVKTFNEEVKYGMNNMLRRRMNEPGVEIRYVGTDLIDMKESEWIEFADRDHRILRLGIDRYTHLPLRWVVYTRDPESREHTEVVTSYTQYMTVDGVKTPLNIETSRNNRKLSQTFLDECKYNSNVAPDLFTRASLEHHAKEATKKGYKGYKDSKNAQ